jgi:hypothetical protein
MMDTYTSEQELRQEAIRRRLQGERRCDICQALDRSSSWFNKWWAEYQRHPQTDFRTGCRVPHTNPHQMPLPVEEAVISLRHLFEEAATAETKYGLIGHRVIRAELERLHIRPVPSLSTIQRILARHGLTHARGVATETAYYPEPMAWEPNAIHATDLITRHVRGGEEIQNFHTLDHYTHAVHLSPYRDKTTLRACMHLLSVWADLGLSCLHQFDNESAFCGGYTHPRVIGRVVRLCLFVGIEPVFIPIYEAKRNYWIESFHSLWVTAFWSRQEFADLAHIQAEVPTFRRWYHRRYQPPCLQGKTPAQMRRGCQPIRLTVPLRRLIPETLPITAGRIHFIRKVDLNGRIRLLNETWTVGPRWIGEYVWATVDTAEQTLMIWHKKEANANWKQLKTRRFKLKHPVQRLLPAFRRKWPRCREHLPH